MGGGIKPWVVYAKRLFGEPKHAIEYLGRNTHKVAISNHRITVANAEQVSFTYKDYRDVGSTKTMTLCNEDFTKRFVQHTATPLCAHQALRHTQQQLEARKITSLTKNGTCTKTCSHSKNHATQMPLLQNGYTVNHRCVWKTWTTTALFYGTTKCT